MPKPRMMGSSDTAQYDLLTDTAQSLHTSFMDLDFDDYNLDFCNPADSAYIQIWSDPEAWSDPEVSTSEDKTKENSGRSENAASPTEASVWLEKLLEACSFADTDLLGEEEDDDGKLLDPGSIDPEQINLIDDLSDFLDRLDKDIEQKGWTRTLGDYHLPDWMHLPLDDHHDPVSPAESKSDTEQEFFSDSSSNGSVEVSDSIMAALASKKHPRNKAAKSLISKCKKISLLANSPLFSKNGRPLMDISGFRCDLCLEKFPTELALQTHACGDRIGQVDKWRCHKCLYSFPTAARYRYHMTCQAARHNLAAQAAIADAKETGSRPYQCRACDQNFALSTAYRTHVEQEKYRCVVCDQEFCCYAWWMKHRTYIHPKKSKLEVNKITPPGKKGPSVDKKVFRMLQDKTKSQKIVICDGGLSFEYLKEDTVQNTLEKKCNSEVKVELSGETKKNTAQSSSKKKGKKRKYSFQKDEAEQLSIMENVSDSVLVKKSDLGFQDVKPNMSSVDVQLPAQAIGSFTSPQNTVIFAVNGPVSVSNQPGPAAFTIFTPKVYYTPTLSTGLRPIAPKTAQTVFNCQKCDCSFRSQSLYDMHIQNDHTPARKKTVVSNINTTKLSDTTYKCTICDETFESAAKYRVHVESRKVKCSQCKDMFCSEELLNNHRNASAEIQDLTCEACLQVFCTEGKLKEHHKQKKIQCDQCQAFCCSKSYYQTHMKMHKRSQPPSSKKKKS